MTRFPEVQVKLIGTDGNAYAIMGRVARALRKGGASEVEIQEYLDASMSGDYDNLLRTAVEWVQVS